MRWLLLTICFLMALVGCTQHKPVPVTANDFVVPLQVIAAAADAARFDDPTKTAECLAVKIPGKIAGVAAAAIAANGSELPTVNVPPLCGVNVDERAEDMAAKVSAAAALVIAVIPPTCLNGTDWHSTMAEYVSGFYIGGDGYVIIPPVEVSRCD